jgi:energy-coupling factor transporter ATP-binding protein EcfA2
MLKSVHLKNFKLHEDTTIEAAPITVFIGPNNSGKSSVFQALLALRQAASLGSANLLQPLEWRSNKAGEPYLHSEKTVVDLGEFDKVLRHGKSELHIGIEGEVQAKLPLGYEGAIGVCFSVGVHDNRLSRHRGTIKSPHATFSWDWEGGRLTEDGPPSIDKDVLLGDIPWARHSRLVEVLETFRLLQLGPYTYDGPYPDPDKELPEFKLFAETLSDAVVLLLSSNRPVYALRGFEAHGYPLPEGPSQSLDRVALGDRSVAMGGMLAYNRDLEEELTKRIEALLGTSIRVRLVLTCND